MKMVNLSDIERKCVDIRKANEGRAKHEKLGGFTLTEVLIGMMILTIAIVTATSLLVGLIGVNKNVVQTQQAYYLAQEGIEAVRNIRDTNWLNNLDFRGDVRIFGVFELGREYVVGLKSMGWKSSAKDFVTDIARYRTWDVFVAGAGNDRICRFEEDGRAYFGLCSFVAGEETGFSRRILVSDYCDGIENLCKDSFLVKSVVNFGKAEVFLEAVLTDWQ